VNPMTRRSAIAKTTALLAVPTAAASASTPHETPSGQTCKWAVLRHEYLEELTWVALCPNMDAWDELRTNDPFLESFHTVRFTSCVVATLKMNSIGLLEKLGCPDMKGKLWQGERGKEYADFMREQWDWLNSPFAQSILNR
jgi:hypothetical protein